MTVACPKTFWKASRSGPTFSSLSEATMIYTKKKHWNKYKDVRRLNVSRQNYSIYKLRDKYDIHDNQSITKKIQIRFSQQIINGNKKKPSQHPTSALWRPKLEARRVQINLINLSIYSNLARMQKNRCFSCKILSYHDWLITKIHHKGWNILEHNQSLNTFWKKIRYKFFSTRLWLRTVRYLSITDTIN